MSSTVKTPAQAEFADLFEKLEALGWTAAKLSRELKYKGQAAVSMILKGETGVSDFRLEKMRELVEKQTAAKEHVRRIEKKFKPGEQLDHLREHHPEAFQAAAVTIDVLYNTAIKGVSSKVASVAAASQDVASDVAPKAGRSGPQSPSRKPAAGAPTGRKGKKGKSAPPGSTEKPEPPTSTQE